MPLAQFNIARARWPLDDPRLAGFTENVGLINGLAERSPGFLWRLVDESAPEAPRWPDDPLMTFTLSLWSDVESLRHFTWNTLHKKFRLRTKEWFEPLGAAYLVCWPIGEGRTPDGSEALARLEELRRDGPSERAFGVEALAPARAPVGA
ncbi:MAG: DUF3291 domain-containing protein [Pseudomonadota bacterium]